MKNRCICVLALFSFIVAGCSSKPNVDAVALTEPWKSIEFKCDGSGVVILSNEKRFNCAYGGKPETTREDVIKKVLPYVEAAKQNGWTMHTGTPDVAIQYRLIKGDKELLIAATGASAIVNSKQISWEGSGIQAEIYPRIP